MAFVEIDLADPEFGGILEKLQAVNSGSFREPLLLMAIVAENVIREKFAREGPGWAPLSPRWAARKKKLGREGPILTFTGRLFQAITSPSETVGGIFEVTDTSLDLGTNLKYAATHQWGRGPIPARPFLPTAQELAEPFQEVLTEYLKDKMNA